MKAIILAAGAGRRLGMTDPKSMIRIGGASIIHRQLDAFRSVGVEDFVVVVGYAQDRLREHLADEAGAFTFIVNERFAETNTIYSLYLAREHIDGGFFYANADVVFDRRLVERLVAHDAADVLAVQVGRCGAEEVKVVVEGDRIVRIGKLLDSAACLGEFVGVARFGEATAEPFVDALTKLVEGEQVVDDYFERAVDRLCEGRMPRAVDVSDLPCLEIDFPADLEKAQQQIAPQLIDRARD